MYIKIIYEVSIVKTEVENYNILIWNAVYYRSKFTRAKYM